MEEKINIDDFKKIDIRIGTINSAEKIEDTDKLLKLKVNLGEDEDRQIVSGIAEFFSDPEVLIGKQIPIIANLEPREIRGHESQGMILAVGGKEEFALLVPDKKVVSGRKAG